jgi:molybdopterin-containing oxidoreductase family membrane subunit
MAYWEPIKELGETPLVATTETFHSINDKVFGVNETKAPRGWWIAFLTAATFTGILFSCVGWLFWEGVGVWGNMAPVYWAWDITNFVWWIGIGHAGTLISAVLFLFRQKWRTSINRAAEAMTIFAVICALLFPGIHVGRPWFAYYMFPFPNQMTIWPNFKSPLLWDLFAVSTYFTVSLLFWYIGLIPDLASLRDRAKTKTTRLAYGFFALGWRGANRHWQNYERAYLILAALATPLVLSVHSVVSFDFATSVIPGWHTTIFPPYFVAGAVFSGFAMVMTLLLITRSIYGMKSLITIKHLELMNKIMLVTGSLVGYAYGMEFFIAWYSGNRYEFYHFFHGRAAGPFWWAWTLMMSCNVLVPQVFWFRKMRRSIPVMFLASILINVGMWFERFVIIVTSLYRDFMPSMWAIYKPTLIDIFTYLGTLGLFMTCYLLFIRWVPMIAVSEVKGVLPAADPHFGHDHAHDEAPHSEPGAEPVPVPGE